MKSLKLTSTFISVLLILSALVPPRTLSGGVIITGEGQEESSDQAREFDEYEMNRASFGDMKARLDGFFEELQREPGARAYIFIYGGKRAAPRYRAVAVRDYLELRGLSPSRLKIVRGGNRVEAMLELWVVPQGARPPKATPLYRAAGRRKH